MKCKDALEMINSYFDNKIDPMKDKLLAEHINSCDRCRAELEFLARYRNILKTLKPVNPPDNFLTELHRKIEAEKERNPFRRIYKFLTDFSSSLKFPVEAAGVLAVATIVFFLYKPFFNEKVYEHTSGISIESPVDNVPSKKIAPGREYRKDTGKETIKEVGKKAVKEKIIVSKNLYTENRDESAEKEIVKHDSPVNGASDFSARKEIYAESAKSKEMKKSPSAGSEKSFIKDEDRSFLAEKSDDRETMTQKKSSSVKQDGGPENLFREFGVSVTKKDLSDSAKLYYRVNVPSGKYSPLIQKLKEKFQVEEIILNKSGSSIEIELFLKKK